MSDKDVALKVHRLNRTAAIIADSYLDRLDGLSAVARDAALRQGVSLGEAEQEGREIRVGLPVVREMLESLVLALGGTMSPAVQQMIARDGYTATRLKAAVESDVLPE